MKALTLTIAMMVATLSTGLQAQESPQTKLDKIDALMAQHLFNPAILDSPAYQQQRQKVTSLEQQNLPVEGFIDAFNQQWQQGPFSHVRLAPRQQDAQVLAAYLDNMRVGGKGALLTWPHNDVAVLTVSTMMGLDTIEQIDAAYQNLSAAKALIIDLRHNDGGAFAVRPLVSHLLSEPLDAGAFASRPWFAAHDRDPMPADWQSLTPWEGWSIRAFWQDVQVQALTRILFIPVTPVFDKPVYVLVSHQTASAAELATAALAQLPQVTVIGEITAGQMLSQTLYDVDEHMQLFLPVADYYATEAGRIEGKGVTPDIQVPQEQAMDKAMALIKG